MRSDSNLIFAVIFSGVLFFILGMLYERNNPPEKKENLYQGKEENYTPKGIENSFDEGLDQTLNQKNKVCNKEAALDDFYYWMDFTYPDWKISGDVSIVSAGEECTFNIRFTAKNPHYTYENAQRVIVIQLDYVNDYQSIRVRTLRGTLY